MGRPEGHGESSIRHDSDDSIPPPSDWMTVKDIAEWLQVSRDTVERWIHAGTVRAVDVSSGGNGSSRRPSWRISSASLQEFMHRRANYVPPKRRKPIRKSSDVIEFIK